MSQSILICTDLDRTLIPNGPEQESAHARARFHQVVSQPQVKLAYVSGRDQQLIKKAIRLYQLPQPDFVIGDVGTTLYRIHQNGDWQSITEWYQYINEDWNGYSRTQISALIKHSDLRVQEPSKQNDHKLSYYVPLNARQQNISEVIESALVESGIKTSLIWSIDEPNGIGLLDIVPARASKYHAIIYLLNLLAMDVSQCVFCGDSGNDMEVLISPINSVLVANATEEIKKQALKAVKISALNNTLYIARGNYLEMNGNYSAGMLEGIHHYFPQITKILEQTEAGREQ